MKRSAKILTLAVALFAGFGASAAHAEGFKTGVDLVSSYVWRGGTLDDGPNIQPTLTYTLDNGIVLGGWGSYGLKDGGSQYKEIDLSVTVPAGPFSISLIDYYIPSGTRTKAFTYSKTNGADTLEADLAYTAGDLSLLAAYNIAGYDPNDSHAFYGEASYKFYNGKDGYSAKAVAGVGSKYFYGQPLDGSTDKKLALVNTGISVSKDRFTASYVYNPISEKATLVFMASF
jgi:hypothetical protein